MGSLALVNGSILTSESCDEVKAGTVLIRDDRIVSVNEPGNDPQRTIDDVNVIDMSGLVLVPGLIDCHVHLFLSGAADAMVKPDFSATLAEEQAGRHLSAGVTTVRDLGGPLPHILELRDKIDLQSGTGPQVLAAGTVITVPAGHCTMVGKEVRNRKELVAAVKSAAIRGVDCIKIAVSGGVSTPSSDLFAVQFSEEELRAAVETAHDNGMRIAAHASNPESIRISARAGVDSVEHAVIIDDAAIEALVESRSIIVPTLAATSLPPNFLSDNAVPKFIREKAKLTIPAHRTSIARAIRSGVPVAAGTDAGTTLTSHGSLVLELEELTRCGLDAAQALAAATTIAARLLGISATHGAIESGKKADIVAVAGNPLQDISALRDVRFVFKDGIETRKIVQS